MSEEGDMEAFCRQKRPRLVNWLVRLGATPADAEDLAQEAFEEIIRRWPSLAAPDRYLFCVARNKLIRLLKAQGRDEVAIRILRCSSGQLRAGDVYQRLDAEHASLLMLVLPPQQRAAFACRYDGLSSKEAAEMLRKSEATIRSSLRAARENMRHVWEDPGTDLNRLVLEQAHNDLRGGDTLLRGVRPVIGKSWARCRDYNVDLDSKTLAGELAPGKLKERRAAYPFPELEQTGYAGLTHLASTHQLMLAVTDADGYVLHTHGDARVLDCAAEGELRVAAQFAEHIIGTNGIGIALEDRHPIYVRPLEHYAESQRRRFACAAAPLLDRNGDVLAVVNLTALAHTADPRMLRHVAAAARHLQSWLRHL